MTPIEWCAAHKRALLFMGTALTVAGAVAAFHLPVTLFPSVEFPRVVLTLDSGDQPAELMALQVTTPVEEAVRRIPGVRDIRSRTSRGSAEVSINFAWGTDMATASVQIGAAVAGILPRLPAGTHLETRRMDPTVFPIIAYSLNSTTLPPTRLYDIAQYQLRPLLASIPGVARAQALGGAIEEVQVSVEPARLQAYGLSLADVAAALTAANVLSAVGRLEDHYKLYLVVVDDALAGAEDVGNIVVKHGPDGIVRLRDVASFRPGVLPQWIRVTADGRASVLLQIYQQPGSNSVQIARAVRDRLDHYRAKLPAGVSIANWYDQSELVVDSAISVRDALLTGVGLAALVLLLFLRELKVTLIAFLVVPAVVFTTMLLLSVMGMSLNIMTLGGLAASVGLIIDDTVVMVEHIVRRVRDALAPATTIAAASEFLRPLMGSSASTIVIFLPLTFLTGVTGAFFKVLSLTMAGGLLISFFATWVVVPLLAERMLSRRRAQADGGRLTRWAREAYAWLMQRLLRNPWLLLVAVVPLVAAGLLAYAKVGSGFMPAMDEGGFVLDYRSAPGTSLAETDRLVRQVEAVIRANPSVETYSRRTGTQLGGGVTEANEGDFFIRLKSGARPPIDEVMDQIRGEVESSVPGLSIELAQLMEDLIGDLTAVPQPIEVKLFSDDEHELEAVARHVADLLGKLPGVVDVRDGINLAGDALEVRVDRARAALEGVDPDAVSRTLTDYLRGAVATRYFTGVKTVGVRVRIPGAARITDARLPKLLLRASDGHLFPLERVASIEPAVGQPQISRDNERRMVAVTARISGRDLGSVARDVRRALDTSASLPRNVYYEMGGLYQQQRIAFQGLRLVLSGAVLLVFLLLLFLYESYRIAIAIILMPLLSLAASFIGLWLTGIELNVSALMGMTMIVGIVTEVAVFYFSEYESLPSTRDQSAALIAAGQNRMRPIAMTTLAAMLTLLPLAFAWGRGAEMQRPLAVSIVAGLGVQLPLVLVAMPVLFAALPERLAIRFARRAQRTGR